MRELESGNINLDNRCCCGQVAQTVDPAGPLGFHLCASYSANKDQLFLSKRFGLRSWVCLYGVHSKQMSLTLARAVTVSHKTENKY